VDGPVFSRLLEHEPSNGKTIDFPDGWVNFYRVDDYAVTSYFYINKPITALALLPPVAARLYKVK
jgi:hypothetical protein